MSLKAQWIEKPTLSTDVSGVYPDVYYICSRCGDVEPLKRYYCPNCGRKMKTEGKGWAPRPVPLELREILKAKCEREVEREIERRRTDDGKEVH